MCPGLLFQQLVHRVGCEGMGFQVKFRLDVIGSCLGGTKILGKGSVLDVQGLCHGVLACSGCCVNITAIA